ncbi:outer membrane protein transport protein [soil metagenome]
MIRHMKAKGAFLSTAAIFAVGLPTGAQAGGFYLQEQSVRGAGRAFSGEVADQGAASLWWNPASIGGLEGGSAHVGASAILPKGNVDNLNTLIVRPGQAPRAVGGAQRSKNPIENGYLPTGAIAYGLSSQVAVGLSVTAPYSFTTNYDADSWARYTADKTKLRTYDIQPSIAVMPLPGLSIGAALNVEYADASLSNALPNLSPLLADGHQELKGNGWDLGWSAGAQYRTGPLTLGASYKSSVKHTLSGDVTTQGLLGPLAGQNATISTKAKFSTPWQASFGARYAVTPALTLNAQVSRFGWSKFDAIRLGAPLNVAIPENYRNTWSFAGGVDYALTPRLTVRGGVQHDQTPTRNDERDARVPDSNRWNFAAGTSYALSKAITLDAAANYITLKNAAINRTTAAYAGSAAQTPILVDGRLSGASVVVLSFGGRLSF